MAARGDETESITAALTKLRSSQPPVIAITGSAGVGKSSLLGAVTSHFAARGESLGVLACDPESPITGGALLGDRCRIASCSISDRVFIRSLSTAAGQQGVAVNIERMLDLMKAFGFDRIFVETVGTGQGDVAVRSVADAVVLVLQPKTGDELQWEKAGILEIADTIVVNKCDLPGSEQMVADVTKQLRSAHGPVVPVLATSVARGEGIDELCRALGPVVSGKNLVTN
ncbi:MAG TPA: AAA family ATPase [Lacipirellulaceae bacterium]|nr:AAA family ATPase [Lacipirellulaceae bacterium]